MADTIKNEFGVDTELIEGSGGIFDVTVDGHCIFSKHEHDRFPEEQEVVELMRK